jgi:hypothetical protein
LTLLRLCNDDTPAWIRRQAILDAARLLDHHLAMPNAVVEALQGLAEGRHWLAANADMLAAREALKRER